MAEHIWTNAEEERQDCVDNAVHNLIEELAGKEVEWDIENIAEVREAIHAVIVDKLDLMTSYDFYPYEELELEIDENIILELSPVPPSTEQQEIIVTDEQLVTALIKAVQDLDAEDLCVVAGDALGGLCWYNEDNTYTFVPTECYWGAFDDIKELNGN